MSDHADLFRPAAVDAQRAQLLGSILLSAPPPLRVLGAAAVMAVSVLLLFFWRGAFSQQATLNGQLVPDMGLVSVHAPHAGVIVERAVMLGDRVRRGDVLMVLSGERHSHALGATHDFLDELIGSRRASLHEQLARLTALEDAEVRGLQQRLGMLSAEVKHLEDAIALQRERLADAVAVESDARGLREQEFVTAEQLRGYRDRTLEQQATMQALERELLSLTTQRAQTELELTATPLRFLAQRADVESVLATLEQERAENDWQRRFVIVAPVDGEVALVVGETGQIVDPQLPLVTLRPSGAALQAHLLAPEHVIGHLTTDDSLRLRYAAFPYQRFGHQAGRVVSVSDGPYPDQGEAGFPVYRVVVELDAQTFTLRGREIELKPGMRVEVRIGTERRRLIEWAFARLWTTTP